MVWHENRIKKKLYPGDSVSQTHHTGKLLFSVKAKCLCNSQAEIPCTPISPPQWHVGIAHVCQEEGRKKALMAHSRLRRVWHTGAWDIPNHLVWENDETNLHTIWANVVHPPYCTYQWLVLFALIHWFMLFLFIILSFAYVCIFF